MVTTSAPPRVPGLIFVASPEHVRAAWQIGGKHMIWLFSQGGIGAVLTAGATAEQLGGSYSIERTPTAGYRDSRRALVSTTSVFRFGNLADTLQAPPSGFTWGLYAQVPGVLAATTESEIEDFEVSHRIACDNMSGYGLRPIVFPSSDITQTLDPTLSRKVGSHQAFLQLGIAGGIATHAEAVGVQSQALTGDVNAFASFIEGTHSQVSARRTLPFFGALGTRQNGTTFTSKQMLSSWRATRDLCAGYWLEVTDPDVVVDFLNLATPELAAQMR